MLPPRARIAAALALLLTACGPEPIDVEPTEQDMSGEADMDAPTNNTSTVMDMGSEPPADDCVGRPDGPNCSGGDSITCQGSQEVAREACAEGCDSISGQCIRPMQQMGPCANQPDGALCDGDDLITCQGGQETARQTCDVGCEAGACKPDDFCVGKLNGLWCYGDDLVDCEEGVIATREVCDFGCESMEVGEADRCYQRSCSEFTDAGACGQWSACQWYDCRDVCRAAGTPTDIVCNEMPGQCPATPATASSAPPDDLCNFMDWELSPDGWYLISRFGTTNDSTTLDRPTSCKYLRDQYNYRDCRYTLQTNSCIDDDYMIPWVQGHVDYDYDAVIADAAASAPNDSTHPEYYYVAGAQRFGCGRTLRVTNPANGRCVVVYAEDGGPGARYEMADKGGRRILDSSPAVVEYLDIQRWGWASADLVYVEWGQPGDTPGTACNSCVSQPAQAGSEADRAPYDLNHMMSGFSCR